MYNIMKLHVELLVQGRVAVKTLVASEMFPCKLLTHSGICSLRTQASLFETLLAVSVELKLNLVFEAMGGSRKGRSPALSAVYKDRVFARFGSCP